MTIQNKCNINMSYFEIKKDILQQGISPIVHTIGSDAGFGAGIALTIKRMYPHMVEYLQRLKLKVPDIYKFTVTNGKFNIDIINLVTKKYSYNKPTLQQYKNSINLLLRFCQDNYITTVHMPAIGSGCDRLNWNDVKYLLKSILVKNGINVYVYFIDENKFLMENNI